MTEPQGVASEEIALQAMERYFGGLRALDPEMIGAAFAETGELEDPVGSEARHGRDAIAKHFQDGLCAYAKKVKMDVVLARACGSSIAIHWHLSLEPKSGLPVEVDGIDVLRIGAGGLIVRAEGYFSA